MIAGGEIRAEKGVTPTAHLISLALAGNPRKGQNEMPDGERVDRDTAFPVNYAFVARVPGEGSIWCVAGIRLIRGV